MNTEFMIFDENNIQKKADSLMQFEFNNKKYIVYELEEEKHLENDIIHIGEYEEKDGKPFVYDVTKEEKEMIKNVLAELFKSE